MNFLQKFLDFSLLLLFKIFKFRLFNSIIFHQLMKHQ